MAPTSCQCGASTLAGDAPAARISVGSAKMKVVLVLAHTSSLKRLRLILGDPGYPAGPRRIRRAVKVRIHRVKSVHARSTWSGHPRAGGRRGNGIQSGDQSVRPHEAAGRDCGVLDEAPLSDSASLIRAARASHTGLLLVTPRNRHLPGRRSARSHRRHDPAEAWAAAVSEGRPGAQRA